MSTHTSELGHGLSAQQLSLLYDNKKSIERQFWEFHQAHPKVYRKLVNLCREVKGAGHAHYSIDALMHRLRWHMTVEVKTAEPFKLNNNHGSFYARMIARTEPDLAEFFEFRKLRAKKD